VNVALMVTGPAVLNVVVRAAVANAPAPDVELKAIGTTVTVQDAAEPQVENVTEPVGPAPPLRKLALSAALK